MLITCVSFPYLSDPSKRWSQWSCHLSSVWGLGYLSLIKQFHFIGWRADRLQQTTLPSIGRLTDRLIQQLEDLANRAGEARLVTDIEQIKWNKWKMVA